MKHINLWAFIIFCFLAVSTSVGQSNTPTPTPTPTPPVIPTWESNWWFSFLGKNITLSECATEAPPVDVVIQPDGTFTVNGNKFIVQGIGYSPTPAGEQIQDWFQSKYDYIYERDIPQLRKMNVTVVRMWEWFYSNDHTKFLNQLWNNGENPIYALIPFTFTTEFYPDLSDVNVRKQCLIDWTAFVSKYSKHPAILGFLIGNELNTQYPNQMDWLFSLINQMIVLRNSIEKNMPHPHPVSVPLANQAVQQIIERYNAYVDIDFWSVQVYSHDLSTLFDQYTQAMELTNKVRPILFTEFGVDYLQKKSKDDQSQEQILMSMWQQIIGYQYSFGGCIMEWSDEWWKGNVPDYQHLNCPNLRPNIHAQCGILEAGATQTYVKEEWLGINRIWNDTRELSLCITPRPAYYAFRDLWNSSAASDPYEDPYYYATYFYGNWTHNVTTADPVENAYKICAVRPNILYISPVISLVLPFVVFLFVILIVFILFSVCKSRRKTKYIPQVNEGNYGGLDDNYEDKFGQVMFLFKFYLEVQLNSKISKYRMPVKPQHIRNNPICEHPQCSTDKGYQCRYRLCENECECYCCLTYERLYRLIYDRLLALPESAIHECANVSIDSSQNIRGSMNGNEELVRAFDNSAYFKYYRIAVNIVWVRYLEGYHIWAGTNDQELDNISSEVQVEDLILYNLVSQSAMTIIHCPEKVSEVFEFFKKNKGELNAQELFGSANEIFQYYTGLLRTKDTKKSKDKSVKTNQLNYDDINYDALSARQSWGTFNFIRFKFDRLERLSFLGRFYNSYPKPDAEKLTFKFSKSFFEHRKPIRRENMNRAIVTFFYNYSWFIRLNIWLILTSWFFVPANDTCFKSLIYYLARFDCCWNVISCVLHWFVRFPWIGIFSHVIPLIFNFVMLFLLFYVSPQPPQYDANSVDIFYLLLSIAIVVVWELYLAIFIHCPFPVPGRRRAFLPTLKAFKSKSKLFFLNVIYYTLVLVGTWIIDWTLLIPSVINVTPKTLCTCPIISEISSIEAANECTARLEIDCLFAVLLTWVAALLVCLVFFYMVWICVFMFFGVMRAFSTRIGYLKSWQDVTKKLESIKTQTVFFLTTATPPKRHAPIGYDVDDLIFGNPDSSKADYHIWEYFIDSMFNEYLITEKERNNLMKNASFPPTNEEAQRRVLNFINSLGFIAKLGITNESKNRRRFRVKCMPSWTVLIPIYNETIFFSTEELLADTTADTNPLGIERRITVIEYLVDVYSDEWSNFRSFISKSFVVPETPEELLQRFLIRDRMITVEIDDQIRIWASLRGQTLSRTLYGLDNYRKALKAMESWEGKNSEGLASDKLQILVCHQTYHPTEEYLNENESKLQARYKKDIELLLEVCSEFDIVYDVDDKLVKDKNYVSYLERFRKDENQKTGKITRFKLPRPCQLVLGEGKSENQIRGVPCVINEVFQANDMNQFNTVENGFKIPFLFERYFSVSEDIYIAPDKIWKYNSPVIPKYRVVGFTEHTYTRQLGMVGELMGMAEFAFVSITQRVLNYPLRVRAHYGHPDFIDGYWVKNRGGPSKATPIVNTNEDIFLAYEIFCRGESIEYVEYIEQQKGRESSFEAASVFEVKLAQGAAQQLRSRELYHLNYALPFFTRCSLFMGSIAFYAINLLMSTTINFYLYSIVLFSIANISYHALGLLGAVIAVPWLIQVGFIQAFPLLVEFIITKGFRRGIVYWLLYLPFTLVFFVFHLRTKAYWFGKGLFLGTGGYSGTGRGFGLDRVKLKTLFMNYSTSHFNEGLKLLAALIVYFFVTTDGFVTAIVRTASIILIVISWLFAPVLFNPFPSIKKAIFDLKSMNDWISSTVPLVGTGLKWENEPILVEIGQQINKKKQEIVDAFAEAQEREQEENVSLAKQKEKAKKLKLEAAQVIREEQNKIANDWALKSWQAWYWNQVIKELNFVQGSTGKQMKTFVFNFLIFLWDYIPFILMAWELVTLESLIIISLISIAILYFIGTGIFVKQQHQRLSRLFTLVIVPFVFYYYIYNNNNVSEITNELLSLIVTLMLFGMILVAIEILCREFISFPVVGSYFEVFARRAIPDEDDKTKAGCFSKIKNAIKFQFLPYFQTNTFLRILPYLVMLLLGGVNLLVALFPLVVDTILYNSRLAQRSLKLRQG